MAEGCPEQIDFEFFRYVWAYRRQQRPKLLDYFQGLRADQSLVCFSDRTQASDYLKADQRLIGAQPLKIVQELRPLLPAISPDVAKELEVDLLRTAFGQFQADLPIAPLQSASRCRARNSFAAGQTS